jgi:hypothetical protein
MNPRGRNNGRRRTSGGSIDPPLLAHPPIYKYTRDTIINGRLLEMMSDYQRKARHPEEGGEWELATLKRVVNGEVP